METSIQICTCESKYQDKRYGKRRRLCNKMSNGQFKCTVCGSSMGSSTQPSKSVKKEK